MVHDIRTLHQMHNRISIYQGDVVLKNLRLKADALSELDLPVTVEAGLLGSLTLKVGCCHAAGATNSVCLESTLTPLHTPASCLGAMERAGSGARGSAYGPPVFARKAQG